RRTGLFRSSTRSTTRSAMSTTSPRWRGRSDRPDALLVGDVRPDQPAQLLELAQCSVPAVGWHVPDQAVDAGLRQALDLLGVSFREIRDGNPLATGVLRHLLQLLNPLYDLAPIWHPAVRIADHS